MADRRTRRRSTTRRRDATRKLSPGARAWNQHVMKTFNDMRKKNREATLKDALRVASKTYKK